LSQARAARHWSAVMMSGGYLFDLAIDHLGVAECPGYDSQNHL
jgi:hypothetical protein